MVNKLIFGNGDLTSLPEKRQFPLPEITIVNFDECENVIMTSGNDPGDENVQWNW